MDSELSALLAWIINSSGFNLPYLCVALQRLIQVGQKDKQEEKAFVRHDGPMESRRTVLVIDAAKTSTIIGKKHRQRMRQCPKCGKLNLIIYFSESI